MQKRVDFMNYLLAGKSLADAKKLLESRGYIIRVYIRDGKDLPRTADFRKHRVNVEVEGDIIKRVVQLG